MSVDTNTIRQFVINFGYSEDDIRNNYKTIDEKYEKENAKKSDDRKRAEYYKQNPGQLVIDLSQPNCSISQELHLYIHSLRICDNGCGSCYDPKDPLDYYIDKYGKICNKCHEKNTAYERYIRNRRWRDGGMAGLTWSN